MINMLILGLVLLAVAGATTTAYAQEVEFIQVDIHAEITDIQIERGAHADHWYFTVEVTNNGQRDVFADIGVMWLEDDYGWYSEDSKNIFNACYGTTSGDLVDSGDTVSILGCFTSIQDTNPIHPTAISIAGGEWRNNAWHDDGYVHILPFVSGECRYAHEDYTCQSVQNIDRLIREAEREADSEPESMTCKVPATTTITQTDSNQPQLLSAAYHTTFADLVLSFDEDATLVDGWQDNITIGGVSIGERAKNHVEGASGLAWISVDYAVRIDLQDAHPHTVTIESGTFMDADGNTNDRILVTPSITG